MSQFIHLAFEVLFGCRHSNQSRAFTLRRRTYKVCLDCGTEIPYSLATMSPLKHRDRMAVVNVNGTAKAGVL